MAHEPVSFSEVVDNRAGVVRARGHLTVQAADLLSGAVMALRAGGHRGVLLDLRDLQGADEAGLRMLRHLQAVVTAEGGELVVLHAPAYRGRPGAGVGMGCDPVRVSMATRPPAALPSAVP